MSLATTVPRKTAQRIAKPATRYWKGKAPQGITAVQSDSDEDEDEEQEQAEGDVPLDEELRAQSDDEEGMTLRKEVTKSKAMNIALKDVSVSSDGKVRVAGKEESGRTAQELLAQEESSEEESEEEEEDSEEESSEESSEDEAPPKPVFRPIFKPKNARVTIAEKEQLAADTEEALRRAEEQAIQRKKESHDLAAEVIKRELLEKEKEEDVPDIDDTDGLDPEAEFEAWRLRELGRIKQEKEAEVARELEREEIERRRALPEEQRLKEDLEHSQKLRAEKPKGQQKFLQKYWHKGAFHQDDEILKRHDYTEATESTVDVSLLPKVMQVKNFGKRSRTKYTHLLDQDTSLAAGPGAKPGKPGGEVAGCFLCGGPHMKKDCPQLAEHTSGANNKPLGERSQRERDRPDRDDTRYRSYERYGREEDRRDRDGRGYSPQRPRDDRGHDWRDDQREYRGTDRRDNRQRSNKERLRSRSPRARQGGDTDHYRRSRDYSRDRTPERADKRRRVD